MDHNAATQVMAPPKAKTRLLRWWGILLVLGAIVIGVLLFPLVIEPWIVGTIRTQLNSNGYVLAEETTVDVQLFSGKIAFTKFNLAESYKGEVRPLFTADELTADVALGDCLGGDVVLDAVIATGCTGNLRRRDDGTVPIITPKDGEGIDWGKVDWWKYYEKASEYWKKRQEEQEAEEKRREEEEKKSPEQRQPPEPPTVETPSDWPQAKQYEPAVVPGRGTRVLIRRLEITGSSLQMPDAGTPFEVTSFAITGANITGKQLQDETMTLNGTLATREGGTMDLKLVRDPGETGTLTVQAKELPLQALSHPMIAGDALAQYGASGIANLTLTTGWTGADLKGVIDSVLTGFDLAPKNPDQTTQQVALVVKQLKGKPLVWPIELGGKIWAPTVTDANVDELLKGSLADAAKSAVTERGTDEAKKLIDKEAAKNPEVKKQLDALKGFGGGLGGGSPSSATTTPAGGGK
ncbi:MAG: hypothetical protein H0W72_13640 [Planctomycetes bacterium]|nr:hypothetical protein [Planctomycetota bacterium]